MQLRTTPPGTTHIYSPTIWNTYQIRNDSMILLRLCYWNLHCHKNYHKHRHCTNIPLRGASFIHHKGCSVNGIWHFCTAPRCCSQLNSLLPIQLWLSNSILLKFTDSIQILPNKKNSNLSHSWVSPQGLPYSLDCP